MTANPCPSCQQLAKPPLSPRTHAPGIHVGRRVLLLGGRHGAWLRDGASHDLRTGRWRHLRTPVPAAFGSEVYALSGRRVVVYGVQLDRWTALPPDALRPVLRDRRVRASRAGTVVTGYAGDASRTLADRWDGLRWHRHHVRPLPVPDRRATAVQVGGRLVVFNRDESWIHTPWPATTWRPRGRDR